MRRRSSLAAWSRTIWALLGRLVVFIILYYNLIKTRPQGAVSPFLVLLQLGQFCNKILFCLSRALTKLFSGFVRAGKIFRPVLSHQPRRPLFRDGEGGDQSLDLPLLLRERSNPLLELGNFFFNGRDARWSMLFHNSHEVELMPHTGRVLWEIGSHLKLGVGPALLRRFHRRKRNGDLRDSQLIL